MDVQRWCLEDRLILQLCRNTPDYGSVLEVISRESVNWESLQQKAQAHRVAALVLDRLLSLPLPVDARTALQAVGKQEIVSVLHDNSVYESELARILQILGTKRIDVILLKGLSLNFTSLRWMGDIDLMVSETQVYEAIDAILEIDDYSYWRKDRDGLDGTVFSRKLPGTERRRVQAQLAWNNEFQLRNTVKGVLVEIHPRPFELPNLHERYREKIEGVQRGTPLFWQHRHYEPALGCFALSAEHSILIACLRNAIKQRPADGYFRLSNLVDIDNLVAAGIAWSNYLCDCITMEAAPYALFSLTMARKLLGTPIPQSALHELTAACTPRQMHAVSIHRRCVESLGARHRLYSKLYKAMSPWAFGGSFTQKMGLLVPALLPSRIEMAKVYRPRLGSSWTVLAYLTNPVRQVSKLLREVTRIG